LVGAEQNECQVDGTWSLPVPTCRLIECEEPYTELENGAVVCDIKLAPSDSSCGFTCNEGYKLTGPLSIDCEAYSTNTWSDVAPTCTLITCDEQIAPVNGAIGCSADVKVPSTTCSFTCDKGYELVGAEQNECQDDGTWSLPVPTCKIIPCEPPVDSIENGEIACFDLDSLHICEFSCKRGYKLTGSPFIDCAKGSSNTWSGDAPTCTPIVCDAQKAPANGEISCDSASYRPETKCSFKCDGGYELVGSEENECQYDGTWSLPVPTCKPMVCETQEPPKGVDMSCSNGVQQGSTCGFTCDPRSNRTIHPENLEENECVWNPDKGVVEWTMQPECCALPCPPYIKMDLVIVLDSSRSVTSKNWVIQKAFTEALIRKFLLGDNGARISIFRYNSKVDEETEIRLIDNADGSLENLLKKFENIKYGGAGTATSKALNHAHYNSLSKHYGNRPNVRDVILVITDGEPRNPELVQEEAKKIRDNGILIFAIGIGVNKQTMAGLVKMAGTPSQATTAENFEILLDGGFLALMGKKFCFDLCKDQK